MLAVAVQAHSAADDGMLEFKVDDVIFVTEQHESGWWGGHKEGTYESGWFPGQRVRVFEGAGTTLGSEPSLMMQAEACSSGVEGSTSTGGTRRVQGRGESDASSRSTRTSSRSRASVTASPLRRGSGTGATGASARGSVASAASASSAASLLFMGANPGLRATAHPFASSPLAGVHHMAPAPGVSADGGYWSSSRPEQTIQGAVQQFADAAARQHGAGMTSADSMGNRAAEIVAILGEISEISRNHRHQEEELREERRALASMETALRSERNEITEARRHLQAERAELGAARSSLAARAEVDEAAKARQHDTTEFQSELEKERRNTEAQRRASEAMKCLYERMIEDKDQELRDQLERAERRDRLKEARIRELTQELHLQREAAAAGDAPLELTAAETVEPVQPQARSDARRRLSYTEEYNVPLLAAQEKPLQLDESQVPASDVQVPSAPPSADGRPMAMTSDTRRRLSYGGAVATVGMQTPETPTFEPMLSEIAQRLFDSHLEATRANSTLIGSTPGSGGPTDAAPGSFGCPTIEELPPLPAEITVADQAADLSAIAEAAPAPTPSPINQVTLPMMIQMPPLPMYLVDQGADSPPQPPTSQPATAASLVTEVEDMVQHLEALEPDSAASKVPSSTFAAGSGKVAATSSAEPAVAARGNPLLAAKAAAHTATTSGKTATKAVAKQKGSSTSSSQRSSSARTSDRSPRSPWNLSRVSPRRSESARPSSSILTPPRVQKESPPRGCVAEKIRLFNQGGTPGPQTNQNSQAPNRSSVAAPPEALRRGPRGVSVPTPTGAGAPAGAARLYRAEADEFAPQTSGARNSSSVRYSSN